MTANPTLLKVRKANEWIREAKVLPLPSMLFDEFWYEGELAIMFGDTGSGKSVLAMQIAEAIARGKSYAFTRETGAADTQRGKTSKGVTLTRGRTPKGVTLTNVLYLDFDHTAKQFEMRYAGDRDDARGGRLINHYNFSNRFHRVEVDMNAPVPDDFGSFDEYLSASLEQIVRETKAKVLIVDNLTRLKRTCESTRECLAFMRELARMKIRYGLSILVLADTPKRDTSRPIAQNDLQGAKLLANYSDSIFALGQSKAAAGQRYIKQIKQRNSELVYHASHVPVFRITKIDTNFLGFEHLYFSAEADLLMDTRDQNEWAFIARIRRMHNDGMTIRAIAATIRKSRSTVHRYLSFTEQSSALSVSSSAHSVVGNAQPETTEPTEKEDTENTERKKSAKAVDSFHDDYDEDFENEDDALKALCGQFEKSPPSVCSVSSSVNTAVNGSQQKPTHPYANYPPFDADFVHNNRTPFGPYALKRARNAYGREIFIEVEDHLGDPRIWYEKVPKKDEVQRVKRGTYGPDRQTVNGDFLRSAWSDNG